MTLYHISPRRPGWAWIPVGEIVGFDWTNTLWRRDWWGAVRRWGGMMSPRNNTRPWVFACDGSNPKYPWGFACLRCGETEAISKRVVLTEYLNLARVFEVKHGHCPER